MQNSKPVLVIGATGFLGTEICSQLIAASKKVKGLVRPTSNPAKVNALEQMGVEIVVGDLKELSSLQNAFKGAEAVISTASSTLSRTEGDSIDTVDKQGQLNAVQAAEDAGVEHFIFISFLASPESFPLQDAKREVEKRLTAGKMNYTILRPTFFTEIWLGPHLGFDAINQKVTIYGHGANKISWIAIKDVAAFAIAALDNPAGLNNTIDLGGPSALSPLEVVKIFEEQSGRPFELQYVPEQALRAQKESATDPLQQSFAGLMLTYAAGAEVPMDKTLEQFSLRLSSVNDYSRMVLKMESETTEVEQD
jgi:uncharacterized protein YbjT (DUF2867 family)